MKIYEIKHYFKEYLTKAVVIAPDVDAAAALMRSSGHSASIESLCEIGTAQDFEKKARIICDEGQWI